ncbi:hypothetical protein HMPREF0322_03858 [Desulfitobacterium hafniense DP7]|uniref:Uncharacterized protein n=2 Tax=Desulfitobacterium hafniense TaxID=49338 RepID=G9XSA9_DESHA|nr:hypothetical protein HMPREF0322_03858 [Desulfitobacterium hafniense DP7]
MEACGMQDIFQLLKVMVKNVMSAAIVTALQVSLPSPAGGFSIFDIILLLLSIPAWEKKHLLF